MSSREEIEAAIEAVLFVAGEPVPVERLLALFDERDRESAEAGLAALRERYAPGPTRGLAIEEVAGGLRIVTAPEYHPYLRKFFEAAGGNKLSMAAIETLAIVAYRQPVTGPEIQELRGKQSQAVLKNLLERRMVRISGRKEVVGRPFLYSTTRDFLMHFGLRALGDLPPLEEFEEALGLESSGSSGAETRRSREAPSVAGRGEADPGVEEADALESGPAESEPVGAEPLAGIGAEGRGEDGETGGAEDAAGAPPDDDSPSQMEKA